MAPPGILAEIAAAYAEEAKESSMASVTMAAAPALTASLMQALAADGLESALQM